MADDSWEYWDELVPATMIAVETFTEKGVKCQPTQNGEVGRIPRWAYIVYEYPSHERAIHAGIWARRENPSKLLEFLVLHSLLAEDPTCFDDIDALKKEFVFGETMTCSRCHWRWPVRSVTWATLVMQVCACQYKDPHG